jgi:hypothetical protein
MKVRRIGLKVAGIFAGMASALDSGRKAMVLGMLASTAAVASIAAESLISAFAGNEASRMDFSADSVPAKPIPGPSPIESSASRLTGPSAARKAAANPWGRKVDIEFTVPSQGMATVKVFNDRGAEVAKLFQDSSEAGALIRTSINTEDLPPGAYYSTLEYPGGTVTKAIPLVY